MTTMNKLFLRSSLMASIALGALTYTSNALSLDSNFRLLGLAMHQETGRNIYLGAIHLTGTAPTPDNVTQSRAPKMMEYRVVARRTSIRSLVGNMLLQSEVANGAAPSAETMDFADRLLSSVQGSLYAGDSLEIKQNSAGKLIVLLNNTQLTSTEDSGIFSYLLKGWVSESGPSTMFRSSILQQDIETEMLSAYETTMPSDKRVAAIGNWFTSDQNTAELPGEGGLTDKVSEEISATNGVSENSPAQPAHESTNSQGPVTEAQGIEQVADIESEEVSVLPDTKQADVLVASVETVALSSDTTRPNQTVTFEQNQQTFFESPTEGFEGSIVETSAARSLDSSFEATEVWTFENKTRFESFQLPDSVADESFDILSLDVTEYSQRLAEFNTALIRLVYSKISYPRRAIRRSLQGALELDVTVLEDGRFVEVAIVESSGYSILDEAAVEAAQQALTDTSLGEVDPVAIAEYGINGSLVIPVPVNFVLQD